MAPAPQDRIGNIRATAARIEEIVRDAGEGPVIYSEQLLMELHRLTVAGSTAIPNSEFRTGQMEVIHRKDNGETVHILCPPPEEVPPRIRRLIEYLNQPPSNEAAMRERIYRGTTSFLQTHPFTDGNGRAGRALLALRLRAQGYLRAEQAVVHFLFDYFEQGRGKQIIGQLIEVFVVDGNEEPLRKYFLDLFGILKANDGSLPDLPAES
jgi:Fic family protein